jgi:hypothetical protein
MITYVSESQYTVTRPSSSIPTRVTISDSLNNSKILKTQIESKEFFSNYFGLKLEEILEIDKELLLKAINFEDKVRRLAQLSNLYWSKPLVNISDGEFVVFEWWFSSRKITSYISSDSIEVIKVWGADIDSEMEDISINLDDSDVIFSLWKWMTFS